MEEGKTNDNFITRLKVNSKNCDNPNYYEDEGWVAQWLATRARKPKIPEQRAWLLTIRRGELTAAIARLMSKYL